jgi:nucleoid-associated protein YgaU
MVRSHREEADMPETYVTKAGDSLTSIAEQAYGDGSRWSEIYEANRKAIGDDSDLIKVGMKLTIPHGGAGSATYVTSAGDTLWHVAEVMYNDGSRWPEIYKANKKLIGDDPEKLGVGLELRIPA